MAQRIAIVDQRPDMLEFLQEQLEARGFKIIPCMTEADADEIMPEPDLVLVDFETPVDLADVLQTIRDALPGA